jgi:hypothetical protein
MKKIIYIFLIFFINCGLLQNEQKEISLTEALQCYAEISNEKSLIDISKNSEFKTGEIITGLTSLNFSFDKNSYVCEFINNIVYPKEFDLLLIGLSTQDYIDLLLIKKDSSQTYFELGDRRKFNEDILSDYPYTIKWNDTEKFLIRLKTHDGLHDAISIRLAKSDDNFKKIKIDTTIESIFLGSILSLIVYNLLIYIGVKDLSYLFFLLYQISIFMCFAGYYGKFSRTL